MMMMLLYRIGHRLLSKQCAYVSVTTEYLFN